MARPSIRRRILLVFFFGVALPVLVAGGLSYHVASRTLRAQALEGQDRLLGDLGRGLWTLQETSRRQLGVLARSPEVIDAATERRAVPEALVGAFLRLNPEWSEVLLFDRLGRLLWTSLPRVSSDGDDTLFDLFFAAVREGRIQTPVRRENGSRSTRMAFEVVDHGELVGVLAATLDLGFLDPQLDRARAADGIGVVLWDDRGLVLGTNLNESEVDRLVERGTPSVLATRALPIHRSARLDDRDYLVSTQRVPERIHSLEPTSGDTWFMALAVPEGRVFASLRRFQLTLGVGVLLALTGAGFFLAWIGRGVSSPLEKMVGFAESIAAGERRARLRETREDEVGRLAQALDRMASSLDRYERELVRQESLAVMGRMSALVAHEIRNPLNAMKGSVQLLQTQMPDEPLLREQADLLLNRIHHLARFVEQLLSTARLPPPRLERATVRELAEEAWRPLAAAASREHIELRIEGGETTIQADREQLAELVQNLARNAIDGMSGNRGGLFEVRAVEMDEEVEIVFSDDGPGIPAEVGDRLFHPFTTTKRHGTGLGLVLCRMVAENHGGSLEWIPGEGGARFRLVLPDRDGP